MDHLDEETQERDDDDLDDDVGLELDGRAGPNLIVADPPRSACPGSLLFGGVSAPL